MFAATADQRQNHQVRDRVKPFWCGAVGCLDGLAQVLDTGDVSQMFPADPGQTGDLLFRKDLLA